MRPLLIPVAFVLFALGVGVGVGGCGLDDDASPVGSPCRSDFDCPEDLECVPADSANADRVCMPL